MKTVDCIALKDEVQRRLLEERERDAGFREAIRRRLEGSKSPVGKLWRSLQARAGIPSP